MSPIDILHKCLKVLQLPNHTLWLRTLPSGLYSFEGNGLCGKMNIKGSTVLVSGQNSNTPKASTFKGKFKIVTQGLDQHLEKINK